MFLRLFFLEKPESFCRLLAGIVPVMPGEGGTEGAVLVACSSAVFWYMYVVWRGERLSVDLACDLSQILKTLKNWIVSALNL